jgi:uroporphyrinogen-III synthase
MSTADADAGTGLAGCRVLVTRPAQQAQRLCELIGHAGGRAYSLPVIEIAAPADPQALAGRLAELERYDFAVFISSNAVHGVCAAAARVWPDTLRVAAVGRGTAAALAEHGLRVDLRPGRDFSSEGLLALDELQRLTGRRVIIFRGGGGRELLAETLRARGAEVVYAEAYRRVLPPAGRAALQRIAAAQPVDAIVVTSSEGLHNLHQLAAESQRDWLLGHQLIVIGERTARLAGELGFRPPARLAAEASDEGLLAALLGWWTARDKERMDDEHAHR